MYPTIIKLQNLEKNNIIIEFLKKDLSFCN